MLLFIPVLGTMFYLMVIRLITFIIRSLCRLTDVEEVLLFYIVVMASGLIIGYILV